MYSEPDLDSLQPLHGDEFLPPIHRWIHFGGLLLVGTFGIAVALAAAIEYNVKVRAIATLRPAQEVQITQGQSEGTVRRIEVSENQMVEKGEVLAYLDSPRLPQLQAEASAIEGRIANSRTQIAQLKFQLDAIDGQILREAGVKPEEIIGIEQEDEFPSTNRDYHLETALATIARRKPDRGVKLAQDRDRLLNRYEAANSQLSQLYGQQERLGEELERIVVRAPISGKVLQLNLRNPGQILRPGDAIARLVPPDAPLVAKAIVTARDIGKVQLNQSSQLRISAYPYPDYGIATGTVVDISPDALPCQGNCLDGASTYYEVIVKLDRSALSKGDRRYPLQPGMEATADIISRRERVITFILRKARLLTDV